MVLVQNNLFVTTVRFSTSQACWLPFPRSAVRSTWMDFRPDQDSVLGSGGHRLALAGGRLALVTEY